MRFFTLLFSTCLPFFVLIGCTETETAFNINHEKRQVQNFKKVNEASWITQETTITLSAIGDVLLHGRVYELQETEPGVYDFGPPLESIEPLVSKPDFLMANQESVPGGVEHGLSTYPSFNSPKEIIPGLKEIGVDMIIAANNHTIDRGIPPLMSALDLYDELELPYSGAYRDEADRNDHRIIEIEGINIGVLSYTFSTNGIPIPTGFEDSVAMMEEDRVISDIEELRESVDILVVHMHWGNEYERVPNESQMSWAQRLADEEVDIIFGHHPHVLQPIEQLKQPDGQDTIVFYSLGNFYSGQNYEFTDVGGVASVEVTKTKTASKETLALTSPFIEPTQVIRGQNGEYIVVPMKDTDIPSIAGESYDGTIEHVMQWLE